MLSVFNILASIYRLIESTCTVRSDVQTATFTNLNWDDSGTRPTMGRGVKSSKLLADGLWDDGHIFRFVDD